MTQPDRYHAHYWEKLDMEMAFATGNDVILRTERLVQRIWSKMLAVDLPSSFPRMTYHDAMSYYGIDKPDLRIDFKIRPSIQSHLPPDLIGKISSLTNPAVDALVMHFDSSPKQIQTLVGSFLDSTEGSAFLHNPNGGPGIFVYDSTKPLQGFSAFGFEGFDTLKSLFGDFEDGHLLVLQARKNEPFSGNSTALGNLRLELHDAAVKANLLKPPAWKHFEPVWIVDFPLFSPATVDEPGQGGQSGLSSTHHPFTSPKGARDVDLLATNPEQCIGDHYDLVINGEEIAGGSRRIHHAPMQEYIFRHVLQMSEDKIAEFAPLLNALKAACPPHAGIAFGFDRLVAMIQSHALGKKMVIRDTIAFPKSGSGEDPMMRSPGHLTADQLQRYHLELRE